MICANWVDKNYYNEDYLKCQDKYLCGKIYTYFDQHDYEIVCEGIIGDNCQTVGVNVNCN